MVQRVVFGEAGPGRGRGVGRVGLDRGQRVVAELTGHAAPGGGLPAEQGPGDPRPLLVTQVVGGQGLAALLGEGFDSGLVLGVGQGSKGLVDVGQGDGRGRAADPEVGQEAVRLQREGGQPGQGQDGIGPGVFDVLGQAGEVLPEQGVEHRDGQIVLGRWVWLSGRVALGVLVALGAGCLGGRVGLGRHGAMSQGTMSQGAAARKARMDRSTAAGSGPRAQMTPR